MNKYFPKISIIVPVFNAEKYLKKCIESIINQTYKNFELILINDESTDNSLSIIKEYAKKDKRIVIINQKNKGVATTRNKGIRLASGEYIAFVDNDDYLEINYLENFIALSENNDVIIGGYSRVDETGKQLMKFKPIDSEWTKYMFITPWARIFKKSFLKENNITFLPSIIGEDIYFNLSIYSKTKKIKIIDYIGYNWLNNPKSISNTVHKGFNPKINITEFLDKLYLIRPKTNNKLFDFYCYKFGIWYLLYSGRNSNNNSYMKEYYKIKKWNLNNNIKMTIFPFSKKLNGEKFSVKLIILFFYLIDKAKLMSLFSKIYCKGSRRDKK